MHEFGFLMDMKSIFARLKRGKKPIEKIFSQFSKNFPKKCQNLSIFLFLVQKSLFWNFCPSKIVKIDKMIFCLILFCDEIIKHWKMKSLSKLHAINIFDQLTACALFQGIFDIKNYIIEPLMRLKFRVVGFF